MRRVRVLACLTCTALLLVGSNSDVGAQSVQSNAPPIELTPAAAIAVDVDEVVRPYVGKGLAPGIAVGVIDPAGTRFYCYGTTAGVGSTKVDENTLFEIGSITKVFTSLVLADMVERGELKLDDTLEKLLSSDASELSPEVRAITLEDLATHTAGLPRSPSNMVLSGDESPFATYSESALLAYLAEAKPADEHGKKWTYSNLGMGLLGYVLAKRAGSSYELLVMDRICEPLGLHDTVVTLTPDLERRTAHGSDHEQPVPLWDFNVLVGCGGLRSTARDLLTLAAAHLDPKASKLGAAIEVALTVSRPHGEHAALTQALGWVVVCNKDADVLMIYHSGATGGYRCFLGYRPSLKQAVVVLCNSTLDVESIGVRILGGPAKLPKIHDTVVVDPALYAEYAGRYQLAPGALFVVTPEKDGLSVQLTGQEALPIYPESPSDFYYKAADAQITFERDEKGKVARLTLHQHGADLTASRLPRDTERIAVTLDPSHLDAYVGTYRRFLGMTLQVTKEGDHLSVQRSGYPKLEVFPLSETRFFYKVVIAEIEFSKDPAGNVVGLTLHQDGKEIFASRAAD